MITRDPVNQFRRSPNPAAATVLSGPAGTQEQRETAEEDARLLQHVCEGNRQAFASLVRKHTGRFYRVAYRFTANRADAEDMVQQAFIKLWERPQMWEADRNVAFTTWFHRVVMHLCLDHQKKKRPLPLADDSWIEDDRQSQEMALLEDERQQLLETEIAALPERQRIALNLCFYENMSNQEAADIMDIRLKALQSLLMRAKMTLKERLKGYDGG